MERIATAPDRESALSAEDALRAIHELSVHEIELEMQNEEMGATLAEVDAGRARFADFYDSSPVGFCSVSEQGLILEANLTLAGMLGAARNDLLGRPFARFILMADQMEWRRRQRDLFATGQAQIMDLRLARPDGTDLWVCLAAVAAAEGEGGRVCRAVLSDISERSREAARRDSLNGELALQVKSLQARLDEPDPR